MKNGIDISGYLLKGFCFLTCIILSLCILAGTGTVATSPKFALLTGAFMLLFLIIPFLLERLHILLFLFIALIPSGRVIGIVEGELTIMPLLGLFVFGLWAAKFLTEKDTLIIIPEFKWLIALASVMIIASLAGMNVEHSFYAFKTYLQLFLLFFLIIQMIKEPKHLFLLGWILIISISIVAFFLVIHQLGIIIVKGMVMPSYYEIHAAARGVREDPNESCLDFSIALSFVLYYVMIYKDLFKRAILIGCMILLIYAIIVTYSMGGFIGLAFTITFFVLLRKDLAAVKKAIVLISLIPILLGMYGLLPSTYKQRIQDKYNVIKSEDVSRWGSGRGRAWLGAIKTIKENPLIGVGIKNSGYEIARLSFYKKDYLAAHNTFLATAAETGITGLLIFVGLIISIMKRLSKKLQPFIVGDSLSCLGSAIYLSIASFLVQAMLLDLQRDKYLFLLLGLAAVFVNIAHTSFQKEER